MSRLSEAETTFRWIAEGKVRDVLTPEIMSAARRIERLTEKVLEGKTPQDNERDLNEMFDASVAIRCYTEKLK